jgi:hypothetical protein
VGRSYYPTCDEYENTSTHNAPVPSGIEEPEPVWVADRRVIVVVVVAAEDPMSSMGVNDELGMGALSLETEGV